MSGLYNCWDPEACPPEGAEDPFLMVCTSVGIWGAVYLPLPEGVLDLLKLELTSSAASHLLIRRPVLKWAVDNPPTPECFASYGRTCQKSETQEEFLCLKPVCLIIEEPWRSETLEEFLCLKPVFLVTGEP